MLAKLLTVDRSYDRFVFSDVGALQPGMDLLTEESLLFKLARNPVNEAGPGYATVITSYSIHYTKLYDVAPQQVADCLMADGVAQFEQLTCNALITPVIFAREA